MPRPLFILALLLAATVARAQPADVNRVLRTFDFEERRLGNAEDLPMNWAKVEGPGLPHYVNGRLATDNARSGQYAFRFDLNGGSLVYRYDAGRIRVQQGAHYRVEGYVRTTALANAKARITAYMVDLDGATIPVTVTQSNAFGSRTGEDAWQKLTCELSADSPKAASLVIELGLLQPQFHAGNTLGQRTLFTQDIRGSAWFDDITVFQIPRIRITTDRPGNIFRRADPLRIQVLVSDRFTDDLAARLAVQDATGRTVHQRSGTLEIAGAEPLGTGRKRIGMTLPELEPGWYSVSLDVTSRGQFVGGQKLDLIQLADDAALSPPDPRFGLVATHVPFAGWNEFPDLLPPLGAGRVKLGIWDSKGDDRQLDSADFDAMLVRLQDRHIVPTGCLLDIPASVAENLLARQRLVEAAKAFSGGGTANTPAPDSAWHHLLKANKEDWQPQLAQLVARHANHFERWQLGADGSNTFVADRAMRDVYDKVYSEFATLIHQPDLAMPWPAWYEPDGPPPASLALSVPPSILPAQLPLYLQELKPAAAAGHAPSITLQLLDRKQYGRDVQIRDFAQRLVYALTADAKRIDLPLPFTVQQSGEDVIKQPQELYMVMRTLLTTLGGATFKGKVPIADGIDAFLFDRAGQGVLVLWDHGNTPGPKRLPIDLGDRPRRVDLWGNVTPLLNPDDRKAEGMTELTVGTMPILLVDIDARIALLRASVAIDRPLIESSFQAHSRRLRFTNPYKTPLTGTVRLRAPQGWTLNPPSHTVNLNPGETYDREISIEFPYNSNAGPRTIEAEFAVQAERPSRFTVPLTLQLGLSDVGMQTMAFRDGNDVVVQQTIQNYGDRPIDYNAFAIFPDHARQERLVNALAPGRTTLKRYRFTNAKVTPGLRIRVGVKELNGVRILNDEVEVR